MRINTVKDFKEDVEKFINARFNGEDPTHYYGRTFYSINLWIFPSHHSSNLGSSSNDNAVFVAGLIALVVAGIFLVGTAIQLNGSINSFQKWNQYSKPAAIEQIKMHEKSENIQTMIEKIQIVLFEELKDTIVDVALLAAVILASGAIIAGSIVSSSALVVFGGVGVAGVITYRVAKLVYDSWNPSQDLIDVRALFNASLPL